MSLSDQDLRDAFDAGLDETLRAEVVQSFSGRQRWLIVIVWIVTPLLFAISVWTAVRFFQADQADFRSLLLYATLFIWSSTGVSFLKSWYYSRLDRNAIRREIRRLEMHLIAHDRS